MNVPGKQREYQKAIKAERDNYLASLPRSHKTLHKKIQQLEVLFTKTSCPKKQKKIRVKFMEVANKLISLTPIEVSNRSRTGYDTQTMEGESDYTPEFRVHVLKHNHNF